MIAPFSIGYVKGWRRSVAALVVADGVKTLGVYDELSNEYKDCLLHHSCAATWSISLWGREM